MSNYTSIPADLFVFLRELSENNNKEWFAENKDRFRENLQLPMVGFIEEMGGWLEDNAPAFVSDTRLNGGSLFRIYRDTRFGNDKTPYKTNIGCHFRHRAGKDAHAPGFYVHLSVDEIFFGGGIWSPPTPVLNKIRDRIIEKPEVWQAIQQDKVFKKQLGRLQSHQSLKNAPRGYPNDHICIDDLKRKSLFAFASCTQNQVCAKGFPQRVGKSFDAISPLMQFMVKALEVGWD